MIQVPTISVIVPVYKVEKYIHRCVDSILEQTYADFELILVDDGSPDNCGAICDEYAAMDSRVVVIHQENGGLSAARNVGIKWARENSESEWISLIDSDDWVHPTFLEVLINAARKMETLVSNCYFQMIGDNEVPESVKVCSPYLCTPEEAYCTKNKNGVNAYPWRFLYHKSLFENIEYPYGKYYEDLFTTHKLLFKTNFIATVEQPLYYYNQRSESIVHSKWTYKQLDRLEAYESVILYFSNSNKNLVKRCVKRGYIFAIHANYLQVNESDLCRREKRKTAKILRKKLRFALLKYANTADICFKTENYLYAIAWPKLVTIYWHIRGILGKFKK